MLVYNTLNYVWWTYLLKWLYIWFVSQKFVVLFLNDLELICLHTSITIVCAQLNSSK